MTKRRKDLYRKQRAAKRAGELTTKKKLSEYTKRMIEKFNEKNGKAKT